MFPCNHGHVTYGTSTHIHNQPPDSLYEELKARVDAYGFTAKQLSEVSGYGHKHILKVWAGYQPGSIAFWQAMFDSCKRLKESNNG